MLRHTSFTWRARILLLIVFPAIGIAAPTPIDLTAGAKWEYSVDEGKTYSEVAPTVTGGVKAPVWVRAEFEVADPKAFAALELTNNLIPSLQKTFFLNGREILPLQEIMYYNRYPGIDPGLAKPGRNVLTGRIIVDARRRDIRFQPTIRVLGIAPGAVTIEVGPVLGAVGPDWFTVTCRTNMHVPVQLVRTSASGLPGPGSSPDEIIATSAAGVFHRFRVKQRSGDGRQFALIAQGSRVRHGFTAPSLPDASERRLRFVVTSDPQSAVAQWTVMSKAIAAAQPDFVVFGGDLIGAGRDDDAWAPEFFDPARDFFARVPSYTVQGNHEGQAPAVEQYFHGPTGDGRARNWVQDFGDVTLVGIDQWIHLDWEPGSENVRWFERALAEADSPFVFVVMHYPAYSSCSHGKVDENGVPLEREIRRAREVLLPLMQKHEVTALLAGHDHYYERTELPDGFIQIITGGAGRATDGQVKAARTQNPFSTFHAAVNHYSLFEVEDGRCVLKAVKADGSVLDTVEFRPRE